jgi:hypothetical protein
MLRGMDRGELEELDRESLVVKAQAAGIRRARILTRPELIDELLRLDASTDDAQLRKSRGFFGRARDLVARVVERGLHLPDAAERIRTLAMGEPPTTVARTEPQAMPTVTLAEIYAAQGHKARAIETLRRVLEREPDHAAARVLQARLEDAAYVAPAPPLPPEPEIEPDLYAGDEASAAPDDASSALDASPDTRDGGTDHEGGIDVSATTDVLRVGEREPVREPVASMEVDEAEIDECFAIPLPANQGGARMYTRWSVSWSTLGALLRTRPNGRFVVRAHVVTPSWDGPTAETRDLIVDPDEREAVLQGLPEPSVVRVAVGWFDGITFVPLAHSPALEMARGGLTVWTPAGFVPVRLDDPRAAPLARALDGSRRAAQSRG